MLVRTVAQQLFFCTSLIQSSTRSGTGFAWNVPSPDNRSIYVLVSNRHVVSEPGEGSFSLSAKDPDGGPKLGERVHFSHPDFSSLWVGHPNPEVDIAAMFLGPYLNASENDGKPVYFKTVSEEICPPEETVENDLDAIEPVVFIGYPNALYDTKNLTPIARRGYTATPIALDYNDTPSFLIDASVFPGSSGSPVFIHQEHSYVSGGQLQTGGRVFFAGIVGAVHVQADTGQIVTDSTLPHVELNQLLDLGIVYNWRAVRETIEALLSTAGLPYSAPISSAADLEITTEVDPPSRPE
jgi:hypothetical protein